MAKRSQPGGWSPGGGLGSWGVKQGPRVEGTAGGCWGGRGVENGQPARRGSHSGTRGLGTQVGCRWGHWGQCGGWGPTGVGPLPPQVHTRRTKNQDQAEDSLDGAPRTQGRRPPSPTPASRPPAGRPEPSPEPAGCLPATVTEALCYSLAVGGRGPVVEGGHFGLKCGSGDMVSAGGHELQERGWVRAPEAKAG